MQLTPLLAVHIAAALSATVIGPVALWARKGARQRPRLHRAFGYAWVTLMLITAISAFFIRGGELPNLGGFSPVHLLIPVVLAMLFLAFRSLAHGNIMAHRKAMTRLYWGACVVAGAFTLLPGRFLGKLIWVRTNMLAQIITNTPFWVWGMLAGLLLLGFSQTRARTVGLMRVVLLPLGLGVFSLWGTLSAFGASPAVLGGWLAAIVLMVLVVTQIRLPESAGYDSTARAFSLPGSWVPMMLIMGIFMTKYAVGVSLAIHPELKANANFAVAMATVYGAFSGIFAGRTVRLMRLMRMAGRRPMPARNTRQTANA